MPRFPIAAVLLVVGCRWLSATTNFEELFLNSLGLAFILELKEIVYSSLTPLRTKRDLLLTKMKPMNDRLNLSMYQVLRGFPPLVATCCWVWLYMFHLQRVLPSYAWDVRRVCTNETFRVYSHPVPFFPQAGV